MRRLSACLMIATLLVALVPSSALAGPPEKPVDEITGITWFGDNTPYLGGCNTQIAIDYTLAKGPPRTLEVVWHRLNASGPYSWPAASAKAERDGRMSFDLFVEDAYRNHVQVGVYFSTRKGVIPGEEVTDSYIFPAGTCPGAGAFYTWTKQP